MTGPVWRLSWAGAAGWLSVAACLGLLAAGAVRLLELQDRVLRLEVQVGALLARAAPPVAPR